MVPRQVLATLVYALPLLGVTLIVLTGGYALASGTGDKGAAGVMWWIAMSCLILLISDLVLLVAALGINALGREDRERRG